MNADEQMPDERWAGLPLPDADKAWEKMSLLLDEDDRRRRGLPWWVWRVGSAVLVFSALAVGTFVWLTKEAKEPQQAQSTPAINIPADERNKSQQTGPAQQNEDATPVEKRESSPVAATTRTEGQLEAVPAMTETAEKKARLINVIAYPDSKDNKAKANNARRFGSEGLPGHPVRSPQTKPEQAQTEKGFASTETTPSPAQTASALSKPTVPLQLLKNPPDDSLQTKERDSVTKKDSLAAVPVAALPKKAVKKSLLSWSAGLSLPLTVASRSRGADSMVSLRSRKPVGALPGLYLRVQKGAWFAQAEAYYAVPQPVQPFSFSQKTTYEPSAQALKVERRVVEKLFYHQAVFSVNRQVVPHWSAGVGGTFNRLARVETERELTRTDVQSGAIIVRRSPAELKGFADSFFYKNTASLLVQTEAQWRRLSLGIRYTQMLQPFIRYTAPSGAVLDERSTLLQAVLRLRLFGKN